MLNQTSSHTISVAQYKQHDQKEMEEAKSLSIPCPHYHSEYVYFITLKYFKVSLIVYLLAAWAAHTWTGALSLNVL